MNNKKLESTRDAYGKALVEIGNREDIVVVDADLSVSTKTSKFGECYPERFFNVGCAEQNLIATAAGLAIGGKTVFASTHSQFFLRGWEVIRTIVAHDQLNVKLVGTHQFDIKLVMGYNCSYYFPSSKEKLGMSARKNSFAPYRETCCCSDEILFCTAHIKKSLRITFSKL